MIRTSWHALPAGVHSEHVFAIGDVHGHAKPLQQALEVISQTPYQGLPKHLIFLGDTIDRGPENLRTAELVQNAANIAKVDKVSRLLGNHEIMLSSAMKNPAEDMMFWSIFGGSEVISEVDPDEMIIGDAQIAEALRDRLPTYLTTDPSRRKHFAIVDDAIFVHAGLSPHMEIEQFLDLAYDERIPGELHWAWIRKPFLEWTGGWGQERKLTVVHGHTSATEVLYGDTREVETLALLSKSHNRINLDAGAGFEISQIAMGEFLDGQCRIHIFQDDAFKPRSAITRS